MSVLKIYALSDQPNLLNQPLQTIHFESALSHVTNTKCLLILDSVPLLECSTHLPLSLQPAKAVLFPLSSKHTFFPEKGTCPDFSCVKYISVAIICGPADIFHTPFEAPTQQSVEQC